MKVKNIVGERFKERPADASIDSHAIMIRGGYIKYVANGIYSLFTPGKRLMQKIERIIREEMDRIGGQEVMFPVVLPGSLWEESGRYESVGEELLRFKDRNNSSLVLGMTHEEAAVHLVKEYAMSYTRYPFMIYQIQTKFRDEARPKSGLLRVREFTMKDAYSFHTTQEDLEEYYEQCFDAYNRIFARAGLPEIISVKSDSGMMGGSISHEFMLLAPIGEDSIAICEACGFKANMEACECITEPDNSIPSDALLKMYTPAATTIEDVADYLKLPVVNSCKAVVYQKNLNEEYIVIFIRGDLDINETKLTNYLGEDVHPAVITEECGLSAGFIGPYGLDDKFTVLYDRSLQGIDYLFCGANEEDHHYIGFNIGRDMNSVEYYDFAKVTENGICPVCGKKSIHISRGIEVGNIFQLGTKYSKAMNLQYANSEGNQDYPIMGCYGIGVGRLAASVCEVFHDDYGPIWPITIAPWQVHICCLRADDAEVKSVSDKLYHEFLNAGIEVIYDDREIRPGAMFSDADLLGIPLRIVVSPRNLLEGCIEVTARDKSFNEKINIREDNVTEYVKNKIDQLTKKIIAKVQ